MFDLLVNPDGFFRERADDPPALPPIALVLVVGALSGVTAFVSTQYMASAFPDDIRQFALIGAVAGALAAVLFTVLIWVALAGVFHVLSSVLYDAEGEFRATLLCTGYGYLPRVFGALVGVVTTYLALQAVSVPPDPTNQAAIREFTRAVQNSPYTLVSTLVSVVVLLWQGFVWTFALKHARSLDLREAAVSVGAPVAVLVLINVWGLV
jgi:hypothetical protein